MSANLSYHQAVESILIIDYLLAKMDVINN